MPTGNPVWLLFYFCLVCEDHVIKIGCSKGSCQYSAAGLSWFSFVPWLFSLYLPNISTSHLDTYMINEKQLVIPVGDLEKTQRETLNCTMYFETSNATDHLKTNINIEIRFDFVQTHQRNHTKEIINSWCLQCHPFHRNSSELYKLHSQRSVFENSSLAKCGIVLDLVWKLKSTK